MPATRKLVLASGSPRRRVLLRRAGFRFEVMRPEIAEEEQPGESPGAMVKRLAVSKAEAAAEALERGTLVLGADTTVVLDGKTLGKPVNAAEAVGMLLRLAGREHRVITGFCLWDAGSGSLEVGAIETEIVFRSMSRAEAESYVSTGEPLDKAGAYAIQGFGRRLVSEIRGSFTNVMGLPMEAIEEPLDRHGAPREDPNG